MLARGEKKLGRGSCARWAEGKDWEWANGKKRKGGKIWAFGPKIERESSSFFLFPFSFKTNLFQIIFKTKFEFLFNL